MSETRLLYVITDLQVGGVPLHLHRLACAMKRRGFVPTVVSLAPAGPVGDRLRDDGIDVLSCDGRGGFDARVVSRLADIIRRQAPDVVHALLFHANLAARLAARWIGFPRGRLLCEIQTVEVERRWHLFVDRWTHRWCLATIGNSPSVVDHLAREARIPRDRLRLIRGGVDPVRFQGVQPVPRAALGLPSDARTVLWTGRLDPVKGLCTLIEAFRLVPPELNAHLLLAGEGPQRAELEALIARHVIADRVHLLGARNDVPALLQTSDVFVLPSRTEGLPNALLEAMAAGRPIVTTNVPGCRDLIEHERTGLVVAFNDVQALAGAVERLLRDRALANRLGDRAHSEVSSRWHLRSTFDAYGRLYEEVVGAQAP